MTAVPALRQACTFARLVAEEPRLGHLLRQARAVDGSHPRFCANAVWYGYVDDSSGLKGRLLKLVGWERPGQHSFLKSRAAYDLAYRQLYDALPPCCDCLCVRP